VGQFPSPWAGNSSFSCATEPFSCSAIDISVLIHSVRPLPFTPQQPRTPPPRGVALHKHSDFCYQPSGWGRHRWIGAFDMPLACPPVTTLLTPPPIPSFACICCPYRLIPRCRTGGYALWLRHATRLCLPAFCSLLLPPIRFCRRHSAIHCLGGFYRTHGVTYVTDTPNSCSTCIFVLLVCGWTLRWLLFTALTPHAAPGWGVALTRTTPRHHAARTARRWVLLRAPISRTCCDELGGRPRRTGRPLSACCCRFPCRPPPYPHLYMQNTYFWLTESDNM